MCRRSCTNCSQAGKLNADAKTVNGRTVGENYAHTAATDRRVIKPYKEPMLGEAGFAVLSGNLFESAVMKTSVISDEFRKRYLENPKDPGAFEGRAIVFEGPEDYHHRINDPSLEDRRRLHAVHPRRGSDRLSGRCRGGQHAAAG